MPQKTNVLTFKLHRMDVVLAGEELVARDLKRAHLFFARGELVPESVFRTASGMLRAKASQLMFTSRQPYRYCATEVLRNFPYLRLATAPYAPDSRFENVIFVTGEENNDD